MIVIVNIVEDIEAIVVITLLDIKRVENIVRGIVNKRRRKNIKSVDIDLLQILIHDYHQ